MRSKVPYLFRPRPSDPPSHRPSAAPIAVATRCLHSTRARLTLIARLVRSLLACATPSPMPLPALVKLSLHTRTAVADDDIAELNLGEKKKKKKKKVVLEVAVRSRSAVPDRVHTEKLRMAQLSCAYLVSRHLQGT